MKLDIKLFNDFQKKRRQYLFDLIFNKKITVSSTKKQLMAFLESEKNGNIKRKIKNDLEFLINQFEFRKKKRSIKKSQTGGFEFPRKWSKSYCKRLSCKKMGFSQKSSCRPYKNCYTNKN